MADIDLKGLPDHDLLVVVATTLNRVDKKLDTVCQKVDDNENRLLVLETEHKDRIATGECSTPLPAQRRFSDRVVTYSGIGGGSLGALALIYEIVKLIKG